MTTSPPTPVDGVAPTELHTDRRRTTAREYRTAVEELPLPGATHAALRVRGNQLGAGSLPIPLAAFVATLERHTGQGELLLGLRRADRGTYWPVRITVAREASFAELVLGILEALCLSGGLPPLTEPLRITVGSTEESGATGESDVALTVRETDDSTTLRLRYNASLFAAETVVGLLADYAALLADALARPETPVRLLRMQPIPPHMWSLLRPADALSRQPTGPNESLVDRFRAVRSAWPDQVAVRGPSGEYSYAELDRVATALACRLGTVIAPDQRIAVLCRHDVGLAAAVWATLMSGCAYVPLDRRHPANRLGRIVADANVAAVVCDPELAALATTLARGKSVIALSVDGEYQDETGSATPAVAADALAYLLYTSGSTGHPKAVMQNHRNVLAHATTYADRIGIHAGDQVALLASAAFDAAVMDFFGATVAGATLTVIDPLAPAGRLRAR
ncbi:MAG TPA: AMP-binding protein, partial [Pseudonocardiaceae bacterium]